MSRVIICGSRTGFASRDEIQSVVEASGFNVTTLVCGMAYGIDNCAAVWAEYRGIPIDRHPYKSELGKAGGPARNEEMATVADAVIAFPGGRGTADMVARAKAHGLMLYEVAQSPEVPRG